jgi:hypothetical protein
VNHDPFDDRLNAVLLEYVEAHQAGQHPDRSQLLSAHPDLRQDLEAFFSCQDDIERVLAPLRATVDPPQETTLTQDLGQLGDFRLLLEVGRGGMGIVYEAVQISLNRRVALKVLPFAVAIDERQRAEEAEVRFQLARRSVDELIQVIEEELADRPGMEGVRRRLLRSALAYYQEFIDLRRDDPDARAELLDTKHRVEKILADLAVLRAASKLYLLCQSVVLDDLSLNEQQRANMKELTARVGKQWLDSFNDVGRLSQAERRRRIIEQARANELAVNSILTAAQQERLRQIGWQSEGPSAFRDPEVVAELKLTPAQREQIRTIEEAALFAWIRNARRGSGPEKGKHDPKFRRKSATEQILDVLSDEQRRRWRRMSGTPVKGTLAPFGAPVR